MRCSISPLRPPTPLNGLCRKRPPRRTLATVSHGGKHSNANSRQPRPSLTVQENEIPRLAKRHQHPLSLADLVKHGHPPLSSEALFQSANFTLSLLPIRLAHRLQALRNLPYIVVSNANIAKIYHNYQHSLSTLLPWAGTTIASLEDEVRFTEVLAELVATHTDTIPILARGFLECRKYVSPAEVTRFLDAHLRARIGTRLIAEQHIALHFSSAPHLGDTSSSGSSSSKSSLTPPTPVPLPSSYIGVIDTALRPASTVDACGGFVADICELRYGVRPRWIIDGEPDTTFAFVPMHLEYIVTELLKNAFRATVERRMTHEPVVITIAPEPPDAAAGAHDVSSHGGSSSSDSPDSSSNSSSRSDAIRPLDDNAPGVTIRIRDRGGGISPTVLPRIWSYSFTTFAPDGDGDDGVPGEHNYDSDSRATDDALNLLSGAGGGQSSIAGLGYGLPLSRAYAEYFGGGIALQSLYGWGTDVYLRLRGVGKIEQEINSSMMNR